MAARYASRFGTVVVALGVGGGIASTMGTATAQADSIVDKITPNVSVSAGGIGFSSGTARAKTTLGPNLAIAVGKNAKAEAGNGIGNSAVVVGNRSTGTATNGNLNRVTVHGDDNTGYAGDGDNNVVSVKGTGNTVRVSGGDHNKAAVTGDTNVVRVGCIGLDAANVAGGCGSGRHSDNNSAAVEGDKNLINVGGIKSESELLDADFDGSHNSITVIGDQDNAAAYGHHNIISVTGSRDFAVQVPGDPFDGYNHTTVTIAGNDTVVPVDEDGFVYP